MNIRPITENDWSCIVDIQAQIYGISGQFLTGNTFVLHDLAVLVSGKGIGKKMVEHFLELV